MTKKRPRRKLKQFPPYRKFGGKKFVFYSLEYFKGDVNRIGNKLRKYGTKYRVVPNIYTDEGYLIYIDSKSKVPHPSYLRD